MITVRFFYGAEDRISGFSAAGHSGTAPSGEDIVCAGVSSLTDSVFLGLTEYLHRNVDYDAASGKLKLQLREAPDERTEAIFQTMFLGMREISRAYPKALKLVSK